MANDIITNLHPDNDPNTNLYPNIKKENIPNKSITTDKLDDNVLSLIGSLKPSGTDTSTNILAYTSNKGIYVATDNGYWYYWNGSAYDDGGVYQTAVNYDEIVSLLGKGYKYDLIINKYINQYGDEIILNNNTYCATSFIGIIKEYGLLIKTYMDNDASRIAFYDKNKIFINALNLSAYSGVETEVEIPDRAYYVRVSCLTSKAQLLSIRPKENVISCIYSLSLSNYELKEIAVRINGGEETIRKDYFEWVLGKYIRKDGKIFSLDTYKYSKPLKFLKGEKLKITGNGNSAGVVSMLSKWSDKNMSHFIENLHTTTVDGIETFEYTILDDEEWLSICLFKFEGFIIEYNRKGIYEIVNLLSNESSNLKNEISGISKNAFWSQSMWKVLCIGDSLTSGATYAEEWGEIATLGSSIDQNYPRILGRMINGEVTNAGVSGFSASDWYTKESSKYNFANFDTFIVWLGTNNGLTDTLDTDVNPYTDYNDFANTETGYYCKIIEKIKADNPSCLIVLTKIFASKGDVATSNIVIDKIAQKYGLLVVDNSDLGVNQHIELHANVANPHFGKAGNIFIANRYVNKIGDYLAENPLRCEYGYSSRTN